MANRGFPLLARIFQSFLSVRVTEISAYVRLNQPTPLLIAVEKHDCGAQRRRSSQGARTAKIEDEIALPTGPLSPQSRPHLHLRLRCHNKA